MIDVAVFPAWRGNPYLGNLDAAVASSDVRFHYPDPGHIDCRLPFYRCVKDSGTDVVHLHWQHPYIVGGSNFGALKRGLRFVLEVALLRCTGVPVVWTIHNTLSHGKENPRVERLVSALLYRTVSLPTAHCSEAAVDIRTAYWLSDSQAERLEAVPHGNYETSYATLPEKREAKRSLGLDPESFVYLHLGHVRTYKRVDLIIDAFRDVSDSDARLVVAGRVRQNSLRHRLETLANTDGRIRLALRENLVPEDQVPIYLAAADAFVYAASRILMSGAIMLALTYGIPLIAPRVGCIDTFAPEEEVCWFAPDDVEDLARALQEVRRRDLDRMSLVNKAAAEKYDWSSIGRRWAKIYESLLNTPVT